MAHHHGRRAEAGDVLAARTLSTLTGDGAPMPDPDHLVHLQFRRFAGCPVCSLHLRSFVARHDELRAAGVREVVVFHSSVKALRRFEADLPFAVVADPDKGLYREFGVESAPRSLLDPRVWPTILRAVLRSSWQVLRYRRPVPPLRPEGGRYGLPADLLIAADGTVVAAKYGVHADDQWTVDETLARARERRTK
jgi:peroxiredoxin